MNKIQTHITGEIISSNDPETRALYKKSVFGEPVGEKIQYTLSEALFLVDKNKIDILSRSKKIPKKELVNKLRRIDKRIQINIKDLGLDIHRLIHISTFFDKKIIFLDVF